MSSSLKRSISVLNSNLAPPRAQFDELSRILSLLRTEIQPKVRATAVHAFGSSSNGLWTKSSDADLTMIVPRCNNRPKIVTKLRVVRDWIHKTRQLVGDMDIVENARIPVLKLRLENSPVSEVDLSVNNISGVENSGLVKFWCEYQPDKFIPIARAVKYWAKHRGINDRSKGTLSTYTILLMIVYVMQTRKMLPRFSQFGRPDVLSIPFDELNGIERTMPFDANFRIASLQNHQLEIDDLFVDFFKIFGDISISDGVEIVDGEIVNKPTQNGALIMRCPLTGKDVNVLSHSNWKAIHSEFIKANELLNQGESFEDVLGFISS
jgi:DNA polymerase sigma